MNKSFALLLTLVLLNLAAAFSQNVQSKSEIKNHFRNGYAPGGSHFGYLIDACYNYSISEGLIYDPANNSLKAEVSLQILNQNLADTARVLRQNQLNSLEAINQLRQDLTQT